MAFPCRWLHKRVLKFKKRTERGNRKVKVLQRRKSRKVGFISKRSTGKGKKQVNSKAFLKQERKRKRAAYTPSILLPESALPKRRKENREKARRFRIKAKANSFQLIEDEDITEGPRQGECSAGPEGKACC